MPSHTTVEPTSLPLRRVRLPVRTARLLLRLPALGDVPDLVRLLRKREVRRLIPIRYAYTHVEARSFVRKARELYRTGHGLHLAITRTSDGAYVGGVGLDGFRPRDGLAHIGYWLGREYWGRGYATEAASRVCEVAFSTLGLHRIETGVVLSNRRSSAVLKRLGFRLEGRSRERTRVDQAWEDDLFYGLLKPELRPFRQHA